MANLNSGTEIYNSNRNITYSLNLEQNNSKDVRIDKFENGVWVNGFDGSWDLKQATEKLFEKITGMTKSHYRRYYGNYQTSKVLK